MFRVFVRKIDRTSQEIAFAYVSRRSRWKALNNCVAKCIESNEQQREKREQKRNFRIYYSGFWTSILATFGLKRPLLDDDEIKNNIKSSLISINAKNFDEAELILHQTLQMANSKQNEGAANYVLDLMANLYYQMEKYEEATQIFTELMRRLMSKGINKSDPAMIEISLKLADIYARTGDEDRAETGFRFCVENAEENVQKAESNYESFSIKFRFLKEIQDDLQVKGRFNDAFALYGMVLETYSQYLITRHRWNEAEEYVKRCLELSSFIYGPSKPHTVILLNNFSILLMDDAKYEKACSYLSEVVQRATNLDEFADQLPEMMCNYAEALWHTGQMEKALELARKAVNLAEELKNEKSLLRTRKYLNEIMADKNVQRKAKQ